MTTFHLTIQCDNAAFRCASDDADDESHDYAMRTEVVRILGDISEYFTPGDPSGKLYDCNGNTVGKWSFQ